MTTSTNLGITLVEVGQVDKEGCINTAIDKIDNSLAGRLVHNMSSDANYTITESEKLNLTIEITDTSTYLTTQRSIILPSNRQLHIVINNTLHNLLFKTATGSGVVVASTIMEFIYCDGTNIIAVSSLSQDGVPYDILQYYPGILGVSSVLSAITMPRTIEFKTNAVGSYAKSLISATGSAILTVKKNGVSIGTITFAASGNTGTFSISNTIYYAGDILTIEAPASQDATLADVYITLVGYKYL